MSRWKQYLVFGGSVYLIQTDLVQGVLHGKGFYIGLFSFIGVLLIVAVIQTIRLKKR